ncbi:MAG TPA: AIPR family protein [Phycisphaerales bacterium]|nr:AIPR family protein [Phycisphaerales bacterium]
MDQVSLSILAAFTKAAGLSALDEATRFEHLACFLAVGLHCRDSFDTEDVVMGKATGIDGAAVIINGEVCRDVDEFREIDAASELDVTFVFVQADRGPSFDSSKLGTFGHAVVEFFKADSNLPKSPELLRVAELRAALFDCCERFVQNPSCRLYYTTTGTWNPDDSTMGARVQAVEADLGNTNLFRDVRVIAHDANKVTTLYRQRTGTLKRKFLFDKKVNLPTVQGVTQSMLGFLPVSELRKIVADDTTGEVIESLFYSNPRDFQDLNPVNAEIKKTLDTDARGRFVLMNNGITIIARKILPTGDSFVIEDYQIVNGCQTCHSLLAVPKKHDASVSVPVRLIQTEDETVTNDIIRATNRQTPVTEEQFFALEEFPKALEAHFSAFDGDKTLYYERRSRQYDRTPIERTRIISQANVIRAYAAMFLREPHRTTRNFSALRAKVKSGKDIFAKGHRKEPYYAAAFALYRLESMFKQRTLDAKYKPARFHILLAIYLLADLGEAPKPAANKMEGHCNKLLRILWDVDKANGLIDRAARLVESSVSGEFNRDNIRTEPTTKAVVAACERELAVTA